MQCKKCGATAPAESAFCPKCGAPLNGAAATAAPGDAPSGTQRVVTAARGRGGSPTEEDIWSGAYSAKAMAGTFMLAGALTLLAAIFSIFAGPPAWAAFLVGVVLVWSALGLVYWYRRTTVRYRLSTYRFFHESGLLSRVGNRIEVIDIDDVTVRQGPIERMFDVGTIRISSSDKTNPDLELPGIDHAKHVADLIDGARRAERNRRGLHIESI
ncbi:MAG: PH domain-containing protein [Pirellulales bacterium]